jgi:hypothetical protein
MLRHVPVTASYSRAVLLWDAYVISCLCGEKATAVTVSE